MSASRVRCSGFSVKAWTTLTVAWCLCRTYSTILILRNLRTVSVNEINYIQERKVITCNSSDVGNPTMLLRPTTTAFFPMISTPDLINNSMHPFGVQGMNSGSFPLIARFPIIRGWKPSTSFSRLTTSKIFPSSKCCPRHFVVSHHRTPASSDMSFIKTSTT